MAYRFRKRKVAAFMATYSSDSESDLDSDFECGSRSKRKSLGGGLKLLNAEYQRDYRQQRKAKKSEEQLQRERELNKLRQRRYRKNRKVSIKRNTRNHTDVQQKKWRELKKKYLNNMPEEKKEEIKRKRCKNYARKKIGEGAMPRTANIIGTPVVLPNTPVKYASVVCDLISKATPNKKRSLENKGIKMHSPNKIARIERNEEICTRIENRVSELQRSKQSKDRRNLRLIVNAIAGKKYITVSSASKRRKYKTKKWSISRSFNMLWRTWNKYSGDVDLQQKRRSDALTEDEINGIQSTYVKHATPLSQKRTVNKDGQQKTILNSTIRKLYGKYRGKRPVSLSTFQKNRPPNSLTVNRHKLNSCLCDICLNVSNKVRSLAHKERDANFPTDKIEACNATLCRKPDDQNYHNLDCIMRKCDLCGPSKLSIIYNDLKSKGNESVTWNEWETQTTNTNGSVVSKKVLNKKESTVRELVDKLLLDMVTFPKHLFTATYQSAQFQQLKENIPEGWIVSVEDFAENWRSMYQDEIQAAHFTYDQATLLTKIATYRCPNSSCNQIVNESIIFISGDLKHDAHFVNKCQQIFADHIVDRGIDVTNHVIYSDGCAAQFKSKIPFHFVSTSKDTVGHYYERSFFGSKHGKSGCDPLGGIVKATARRHVLSRAGTITSAKELYEFASQELTIPFDCNGKQHNPRMFFFIDSGVVKRTKLELRTLNGTQQVHQVKHGNHLGQVKVRNMSCFCESCVVGRYEDCPNKQYTGNWAEHTLEYHAGTKVIEQESHVTEMENETDKTKMHFTAPISVRDVQNITKELIHSPFETKISYCQNLQLDEIAVKDGLYVESTRRSVDEDALALLKDCGDIVNDCLPVIIRGDGNCLARCGSLLVYGNERFHRDIRLRIAIELITHSHLYLNAEYLQRGWDRKMKPLPTPTIYAMFSDHYCNQQLTQAAIRELYCKEVNDILKPGSYMGIWQLFALSSVLGCALFSIYPKKGSPAVQKDLCRVILPRNCRNDATYYIMWSSCRRDMTVEHWIPNHFTVCLPYTDEVGDGVESIEESDLHDAELVTDGAELATDGTEPVTTGAELITDGTEQVTTGAELVTDDTELVTASTELVTECAELVTDDIELVTDGAEQVTDDTELVTEGAELLAATTELR